MGINQGAIPHKRHEQPHKHSSWSLVHCLQCQPACALFLVRNPESRDLSGGKTKSLVDWQRWHVVNGFYKNHFMRVINFTCTQRIFAFRPENSNGTKMQKFNVLIFFFAVSGARAIHSHDLYFALVTQVSNFFLD
jgi:hypothetical protein